MSTLIYRGSIALAAVAVVLLSSRPAAAQGVAGTHHHHGGLIQDLSTGAWYDRANQADAERHIPLREAKLRRDTERGNTAAVARDVRRIEELQFRVLVDEWLIRKNNCQQSGYYPYPVTLDPMTYCAIGQYRLPPRPPGRR